MKNKLTRQFSLGQVVSIVAHILLVAATIVSCTWVYSRQRDATDTTADIGEWISSLLTAHHLLAIFAVGIGIYCVLYFWVNVLERKYPVIATVRTQLILFACLILATIVSANF